MKQPYQPIQFEHTNFQNFNLICEGIKGKGIYLLEYHDSYLKDAFVSQIAEQFVNRGTETLFIQQETTRYSLSNIILSRTLFKQNPHNYSSLQQIPQSSVTLLTPPFDDQFNALANNTSILSVKSTHPVDYLKLMFQTVNENAQIKLVIIDSHTDVFYKMNLIPQLSKLAFNKKLTILFTSQVTSERFTENCIFLPAFINNSFYLHSHHADLYSLSDAKDIAYDFQLDIRTSTNKRLKNHYVLHTAGAYCQEG